MRVLVIGGTRFIGPHVVHALAAEQYEIMLFHRGEHRTEFPKTVLQVASAEAAMPIRTIPDRLRAFEPDVVLHMIAMGEEDTRAAVDAFAGIASRIVLPSSGDVYRAYGVLKRIEEGPLAPVPLSEDAPLRTVRYPYRRSNTPPDALEYYYDKVVVEEVARSRRELPATILRLPKVYGARDNADLATVYGFRNHPNWRWTHGHVCNVAGAIARAVQEKRSSGKTYNVGEQTTPTVAERLAMLPDRPNAPLIEEDLNFDQDIVYDTSRIRSELGYSEIVDEPLAMRKTIEAFVASTADTRG